MSWVQIPLTALLGKILRSTFIVLRAAIFRGYVSDHFMTCAIEYNDAIATAITPTQVITTTSPANLITSPSFRVIYFYDFANFIVSVPKVNFLIFIIFAALCRMFSYRVVKKATMARKDEDSYGACRYLGLMSTDAVHQHGFECPKNRTT